MCQFELLMSVSFRLILHFKSCCLSVPNKVTSQLANFYANIYAHLGEYKFWTHLHCCRRQPCLHEDAKVTWVCCTCPPALIGAELAWFAQSFCPVTIGCGPNPLTITALLLVVLPPVNLITTSANWGKTPAWGNWRKLQDRYQMRS